MNITISIRKKIIVIGVLVALLFTISCKKYVDLGTPPGSIGTGEAFADSTTAIASALGIYGGMASGGPTANPVNNIVLSAIIYGAMSADEGYYLTNTDFDAFKDNTLAAGGSANNLWNGPYARIARVNYAIEGLTKTTGISTTLKNQLLGESKFMRAFLYFYLVNFFGDVPLVTSTDALNTSLYPRTPAAQVYQQIEQDLQDAKALLTTTYPSAERARANKMVVSAFLARVYFYEQKWTEAETEASAVIGSGMYSLVTDLTKVFLNNSNETIWQVSLAGTSTPATIMGSTFIPASTTPTVVLYDTLANTFEANDQRKTNWTKSISYLSKNYLYPYKYKVRSTTTGNEYPVMIRLAEMYLIRAEARVQQNNMSGAQSDLNAIRNRAGLPNTTATTQANLLAALEHERWVELFTEFSDRWFNLKRMNKTTAVLSLIKPQWKSFQQLYPIPQQARTANPNLLDNPGY